MKESLVTVKEAVLLNGGCKSLSEVDTRKKCDKIARMNIQSLLKDFLNCFKREMEMKQ